MIQRRIEDPLALEILNGKYVEGDTIEVDAEGGGLVIRKARRPEPAAVAGA